jgi:hypothetical protein
MFCTGRISQKRVENEFGTASSSLFPSRKSGPTLDISAIEKEHALQEKVANAVIFKVVWDGLGP